MKDEQNLLRQDLFPDEELLWAEQPKFGPSTNPRLWTHRSVGYRRPIFIYVFVISLALEFIALLLLETIWGSNLIYAFALLNPAILLISFLYIIASYMPFKKSILPAKLGRVTLPIYAITTRRVMLVRTTPKRKVTSFYAGNIGYSGDFGTVKRKEQQYDGHGAVVFAQYEVDAGEISTVVEVGFFGIHDAEYVEKIIRQLKRDKVIRTLEATPSEPKPGHEPGQEPEHNHEIRFKHTPGPTIETPVTGPGVVNRKPR